MEINFKKKTIFQMDRKIALGLLSVFSFILSTSLQHTHGALFFGYRFIRENGESPMHLAMAYTNPCILRAITRNVPVNEKTKTVTALWLWQS